MKGTDPMRRILLVLTLVVALLALPAAAFAQDAPILPPVPCGDLSEEDCAILQDSQAASMELFAYDATLNFDFALTDVPDLPQDISFGFVSDGSFSFSPEFLAQAMEFQAMMQENDMSDPMAMMEQSMDIGMAFYDQAAFDMVWDVTLSDDVAALLSQQAGVTIPTELNLPLRLVDGFFYANLDDVAQIVPGLSGWIGFDMVGFLEASMDQTMAMMEEGMSEMDPATMGAMMGSGTAMNPELQAAVEANTMVERLDDATVNGADVATFLHTFDFGGFLSDPAVIGMLVDQLQAQVATQNMMSEDALPLTEEDIAMVAEMVPMLAPMLLSGLEWETVNTIGLDDLFVYTTDTSVSWDLGQLIGMAGAMMGDASAAGQQSDAFFSLDVAAENSNFNGDVTVEAPEGAMIIPLDQMLEDSDASM
jgi:hypothetical protein